VSDHPSKRDLQDVRRAIRKRWPVEPQVWEQSADDAMQVILDPQATLRHKLGAMLLFVDAAALETFDVVSSLKRILGRCQNGTTESSPARGECS
jgi:hypothetical protein